LRIKIHKFKIKDHNEKDGQLRCWQLSLTGVKLHEIKSLEVIMDGIKRNWENRDSNKLHIERM